MTKFIIAAIVVVLVAGGGIYFYLHNQKGAPVATALFTCDAGKTINATFYKSSVSLVLSDGRTLSLPQAISADGARYANKDESIVFWNKGDTAFMTEGSPAVQTFSNCAIPNPALAGYQTYASSTMGITVSYPPGYILDDSYRYQFSPKKVINGVKFIIPATMATGTNLSSFDTGVAVEQLPRAKLCTGDIYLTENVKAYPLFDNNVQYSVASSSQGAAGNFYDEIVYALASSSPCTAVRYFIHSTDIGNYPPGMKTAFNEPALLSDFDSVRHSLVLTQQTP